MSAAVGFFETVKASREAHTVRPLAHLPGKHDQKSHGRRKKKLDAPDIPAEPEVTPDAAPERESTSVPAAPAPAAVDYGAPTSTPTRMTKGQYTKLLKEEHVRLHVLDGKTEKEAKALARPAASIDELKERNKALRQKLRGAGIDYRTEEQKRSDDTEKTALLDEVQRLATEGGFDGVAKRAAASKMTAPELRKFVADVKQFNQRQKAKAEAARQGAAEAKAWRERAAKAPATARQVDYIMNLLARRERQGEGGGFMTGPTSRAEVAKMSQADASAYIDSLTGNY